MGYNSPAEMKDENLDQDAGYNIAFLNGFLSILIPIISFMILWVFLFVFEVSYDYRDITFFVFLTQFMILFCLHFYASYRIEKYYHSIIIRKYLSNYVKSLLFTTTLSVFLFLGNSERETFVELIVGIMVIVVVLTVWAGISLGIFKIYIAKIGIKRMRNQEIENNDIKKN